MGLVEMKNFNYVPLTWISLELLIWIQNIFPCKQWDLLNENSTMSHWTEYLLLYILIFYIYKICKQWDLNPHSFTLLFPKNSLSTNFNMLTLLYIKIHYPKNPIRVTPIVLPFYYSPFNPYHHSQIHYQSIYFITPTKPYYLQHKKKTHPNIYITLHLLIYS